MGRRVRRGCAQGSVRETLHGDGQRVRVGSAGQRAGGHGSSRCKFGAEDGAEHAMAPGVCAGRPGGPAEPAPVRGSGGRLAGQFVAGWGDIERGDSLRQRAQFRRCVRWRQVRGEQRLKDGVPSQGDPALRWRGAAGHLTV